MGAGYYFCFFLHFPYSAGDLFAINDYVKTVDGAFSGIVTKALLAAALR